MPVAPSWSAITVTATATDKAGNSINAQSAAVKIDRIAPNTTVTAPPAWNKSDVTLALVANDALSGVDKTYYRPTDRGKEAVFKQYLEKLAKIREESKQKPGA